MLLGFEKWLASYVPKSHNIMPEEVGSNISTFSFVLLYLHILHSSGRADSNTCDVASETNNAEEDSGAIVTVLSKGNLIDYVIPSFPVYCAKLVEVKIQ